MPDGIDDTTATLVGHALIRWLVDDDPAGVARFLPDLDASAVDDAKAERIGRSVVELLQGLAVA